MSEGGMLAIDGTRETGQDVRTQNMMAAMSIANIVKSSLGPVGLDKMLVDQVGDVTITNDGATILRLLEVDHPAGKVLCELAALQDQEVGDGTTSVVILAAELLRRGNELVKQKIHPTSIISGYRLALKEAVRYIKKNLTIPLKKMERSNLIMAARTSMNSKLIGPESEFYANMAVDAMINVKTERPDGTIVYPLKAVNIIKAHGRSSKESVRVDGYAINCTRAAQGMPTVVKDAKIALLDFNLSRHKLKLGVQVLVKDPRELEALQQREVDITKEKIQSILRSGANVIMTTKGIDDLCLKYFVEAGAIAVRRCGKDDLRRIAKATGGQLVLTMADSDGGEAFDPEWLGSAKEVCEERVGDGELMYVKGCVKTSAQTIVLRGANEFFLDEVERSLVDVLSTIKRTLETNTLVAGGGAVESALSVHLEDFASTLGSREQLSIVEFAQALLVIPRTLATNAAQDATELVAILRAQHAQGQLENIEEKKYMGLDLVEGIVRNNYTYGVVEPAISKVKSLRFACEAAVTILRIDDMIKLNPSEKPQ
uniref:T-complex protein 1 subunit alpha n=1 Tax=Mucochytrium quahogii TaxID=96639 RepID=A0A7S2W807_9STRA|mmetsp:Transcript_3463/g.6665  ORF Transcript_3463/g.6665 Transcript_3463/m.6665 type:complete len:542 (-) Transcript_3463:152-1777(-)|eukprot:CAMPEP_0203756836 /NCGR_PEP_ID=MMETSP0098-20131031/10034_1 /ASSEMBLY_ACC=CAM_ASM_000208 /TAXON_ID=96639 /ORGANISM=" , Strain NY0313808BC1" /LENGTH=541 /DNA_ID=CAMNT_0050648859 /DNA_START=70 /DNA_END=1695 /DNA_ORIENTATION=-